MDPHDETVDCDEHGPQPATFVCRHVVASLRGGGRVGFWTSNNPDTPRPDAWCDACEAVSNRHGGWDEESEAEADVGVTLLCGACYDRARSLNTAAT